MRRYQRYLLALTGVAFFALFGAGRETACGEEPYGPGYTIKKSEEQTLIENLEAAEVSEVDRVICVLGGGGANVTVSYHTKDKNGLWKEEFSVSGLYGENGSSKDKREGDKKTPLGTYRFTMAFGILDNPGSVLPYRKLTEYDYWVDDSGSPYYNQMVDSRETGIQWKSAEHMAGVSPFYNYGLALNYNEECVPGKGSAIFLHCTEEGDTGTSGCIEIPEEYMKKLVMEVDENTRITIVSSIGQ